MLRGLVIPFFILLPGAVFMQEEPNAIYVPVKKKCVVLNGSDVPANGTANWEWIPHQGQPCTKILVRVWADEHGWRAERLSEDLQSNGPRWHQINNSPHLTIENVAFEAAGLFTFRQMEPEKKILKQYEIFSIKVGRDPRYQFRGSDVTLHCTISKLPDTISLHWTEKKPSQQSGRNNTDQIQLNNTVYLIVHDVQMQDKERYACEIQDQRRTVLTVDVELYLSQSNYGLESTSYWPILGDNSLSLNCDCGRSCNQSAWYWKQYNEAAQGRKISSVNTNWNRIRLPHFNGMRFPLQISPIKFEDAGNYTCTMDTAKVTTVELITTKVTVFPSHPLAEENHVTLTCSVSRIREATRLIWMETGGKSFAIEKTFNSTREGNNSLSLFIPKIGHHNRRWTCLVFNRQMPRFFTTIQLDVTEPVKMTYLSHIVIPMVLALLLCLVAAMIIYHSRIHKPGQNQSEQSNQQPSDARQWASGGEETSVIYGTVIQ
ncbi:vascular cell adhesion protein 1-like isoform X2 [Rhinoraja longicauda]